MVKCNLNTSTRSVKASQPFIAAIGCAFALLVVAGCGAKPESPETAANEPPAVLVDTAQAAPRQAPRIVSRPQREVVDEPTQILATAPSPLEYDQLLSRAQAGDATAQAALGEYFMFGTGGRIDYAQAVNYFQSAAQAGQPRAQYHLAQMYFKGTGVPQDLAQAATLFLQAAQSGDRQAQYEIGELYSKGQGVQPDPAAAREWFAQAASKGDAMAEIALKRLAAQQANTALSPEELIPLYEKAAKQGYAQAQLSMAGMYTKRQDFSQAFDLYSSAAAQGNPEALRWVGNAYLKGTGTQQDVARAISSFFRAADTGDAAAQFTLGQIFLSGQEGVEADPSQGLKFLQNAAQQNYPGAQREVASAYEQGRGTPQNSSAAYYWYQKAAQMGDDESIRKRDEIAARLTPAQLEAIQQRARNAR